MTEHLVRSNQVLNCDDEGLPGVSLLCGTPIDVTTRKPSVGHALVKHGFSTEKLAKAINQAPFAGVRRPTTEEETEKYYDQDNWKRFVEQFFADNFAPLSNFEINFDIPMYDDLQAREDAEASRLEKSYQEFQRSGLSGQAGALKTMYDDFSGMRKGFSFMYSNKVLQPLCIMPMNYLPDLFAAAPVWYTHMRGTDIKSGTLAVRSNDIRQLCRIQATQAFANMFLTLNHKNRSFEDYDGDIVPEKTAQLIPLLKDHYDMLAIATPYLDVVAREYNSLPRNRMIDPYLIGFNWKTPNVFYFFSRWSNTGLFPLVEHMIANTMEFLQQKVVYYDKLSPGQGNWGGIPWLRATDDFNEYGYDPQYMGKFKAQLVKAYQNDELFGLLKPAAV